MAIELLGGRILAPYFGNSIYVWGSLITVFMLALSIGYLLGGRFSLRNPSLLRFGSLFLFSAAAVLPLLFFGNDFMDIVFEHIEDPRYGSLVASLVLFFLPTVALGMISPYAVRLLVEHRDQSGHVAGKLYFVSTIGSALGTLLTSFYLVLYFEVNQILVAIFAALILCGVVAAGAGRRTLIP
ncbi:MAG: fused MFS/spermidine synthase [Gammaproteobacteria bacterium]|nr:fused MFS/spermidine synthase [Gammaproteobacteria bacterium]MDH3766942.1 fused MFS/spermidine synthase [Gammaproteobacteria bacterium]